MNVPQLILSFWLTIAHQEKINLGRIYVFDSSQSELRLPLLQVVSINKYFSVGVERSLAIFLNASFFSMMMKFCFLIVQS